MVTEEEFSDEVMRERQTIYIIERGNEMAYDVLNLSRNDLVTVLSRSLEPLRQYQSLYNQQIPLMTQYTKYGKKLGTGRTVLLYVIIGYFICFYGAALFAGIGAAVFGSEVMGMVFALIGVFAGVWLTRFIMNKRKRNYYQKAENLDDEIQYLDRQKLDICVANSDFLESIPEGYRYFDAVQYMLNQVQAKGVSFAQAATFWDGELRHRQQMAMQYQQMQYQLIGDMAKAMAITSAGASIASGLNNINNSINSNTAAVRELHGRMDDLRLR